MAFEYEQADADGKEVHVTERDWFPGLIVKLKGMWAEVKWENNDGNLQVNISDERRGVEKSWVMLKDVTDCSDATDAS